MLESSKEKTISNNSNITLTTEPISTHLLKITIKVPSILTKEVYDQTVKLYKEQTYLSGFKKYQTPTEYLEENYKEEIENNLKNFFFKHIVLDFLMDQIRTKKIPLTNYPRLIDIKISKDKQIDFVFNISIADQLELKEWKNFVFRAPKRKRYKDLDKQVTFFIKNETSSFKKHFIETVQENDWVQFDATLVSKTKTTFTNQYKSSFWIKVNNKYIARPFQSLLIGKNVGDSFTTDNLPIKNDFSEESERHFYPFLIKIKAITKGNHLCLDTFRLTFKLKSKNDVHKKLIEVFSYRNDISQRKAIIEELFHLLLSKHRFEVPKHFVIRREEEILSTLKQHPDYQVYKLQKDFFEQIEALAEKQLKEEIIIDQIAYKDNIKVDERDLKNYLHLFNNNRLKEFVYFKPTLEKIEDTDSPLQMGLLKQTVLREKTLNYIIHSLTK